MQQSAQKTVNISHAMRRKLNASLVDTVRNNSCLGNSDRKQKHMVQDFLMESCSSDKDFEMVAERACLMPQTVRRVAHQDREADYQPRADTMERILQALDIRLVGEHQIVQKKYLPQTKRPELEESYGD